MKKLFVSFIMLSLGVFAQENIDLSQGTFSLKGSLWAEFQRQNITDAINRLKISSDVSMGYFLADQWEVHLGLPINWYLSDRSSKSITGVLGLRIGSSYYFSSNRTVIPYIEAGITPKAKFNAASQMMLAVSLGGGILLSLSESVGLDFGFRPELSFRLRPNQHWLIEAPIGFFGIRAFF